MAITEAMQSGDFNIRVSCGDRWLVCDGEGGWAVYEQKHRKRVQVVDVTDNEEKAVSILVAENVS